MTSVVPSAQYGPVANSPLAPHEFSNQSRLPSLDSYPLAKGSTVWREVTSKDGRKFLICDRCGHWNMRSVFSCKCKCGDSLTVSRDVGRNQARTCNEICEVVTHSSDGGSVLEMPGKCLYKCARIADHRVHKCARHMTSYNRRQDDNAFESQEEA
jgi:hypothetical protein